MTNRVGIIDIGSNSIRLVVFDAPKRGSFPVVNESQVCELGRGVADDGALTADAMDCAERAVHRLVRIAEALRVSRLDLLATAAIRDATNGGRLAARLEAIAGQAIRVIDAGEEARLSALGVASGFMAARGVMGDLGGGSLELAKLKGARMGRAASLPLGSLRLLAHGETHKALRKRIDRELDGVPWLAKGKIRTFYAVGGSWRCLARIFMTHKGHPIDMIHGFGVGRREAMSLCEVIYQSSPESLEKIPDVPRRRAEALPSAALVMGRLIKRMKPKRIAFSAHGLREGWLYDLLGDDERARDPLMAVCQDGGFAPRRSDGHAGLLIDWTAPLFAGETQAASRLRHCACLLSDVSWREPPDHRAGHSFYRALYLPMAGLDHAERAYLAATLAARHGESMSGAQLAPVLGLLSQSECHDAAVLGAALRLGYAISGGVTELLGDNRLSAEDGLVRLDSRDDDPIMNVETVQRRFEALKRATAMRIARIREYQ